MMDSQWLSPPFREGCSSSWSEKNQAPTLDVFTDRLSGGIGLTKIQNCRMRP